jgi:NADPH-dependent 2,4-dienoyl-CoA reductase/sulfur reductase-like enzyme
LPGADLSHLYYLRQVEDARQIRRMAQNAQNAVVIGGSFIGMEATAVLQSQGVAITMLFPEERVWQAFFTPVMSAFFENYYRQRGVTIMPQQEVASFVGDDNGQVAQVLTKTGLSLPADMVVAGIGVVPNSDLFKDSELQRVKNNIVVNRFLETNMPNVLAAGDVTSYEDVIYERPLHVEHWDNAVQQGQHAVQVMLGKYQPYEHVPYFFSDMFDLSYEFWGDTTGATQAVHRGDVAHGRFSVWWLAADGRLLAAFVMNRPEEERQLAPKWIKAGKQLTPTTLSDRKTLQPE